MRNQHLEATTGENITQTLFNAPGLPSNAPALAEPTQIVDRGHAIVLRCLHRKATERRWRPDLQDWKLCRAWSQTGSACLDLRASASESLVQKSRIASAARDDLAGGRGCRSWRVRLTFVALFRLTSSGRRFRLCEPDAASIERCQGMAVPLQRHRGTGTGTRCCRVLSSARGLINVLNISIARCSGIHPRSRRHTPLAGRADVADRLGHGQCIGIEVSRGFIS